MRNPEIEFDRLKMYLGEPYVIHVNDVSKDLVVLQPTIGDIISFGEKRFYHTLYTFICNTTMYRLSLWKQGIDWNEMSDFALFCLLYHGIDQEAANLLFKDVDFSNLTLCPKKEGDKESIVLVDFDSQIEIDENAYNHFSQYLRNVFNIFPEEKLTKDPVMKKWFIRKDERKLQHEEEELKKGKAKEAYSIQPIISACINHPGFKYKLQDLKTIGVCEFYDSVKRLQIYESSTALMKGLYSGFINGKDINPENYNFMRETR